ncbi:hypothetical protein GF420_00810 [candidate division GN15 bacterium]|nr:hypothetical protein [candidate division GN15 bacterium]
MNVRIGRHTFDRLHAAPDRLKDTPGVYAVLSTINEHATVIDVGESDHVKSSVMTHTRRDCWERIASLGGSIAFAVAYYGPESTGDRRKLVRQLRQEFIAPCSEGN